MAINVLVIEDDLAAIRLISYTLEDEGYEVVTVPNGLEGLRKALEQAPDLVVLDVMLPGLDGLEICRTLRRESHTCHLPILMFSAKAREIDKTAGLEAGADDYLIKPADPMELVDRVGRLLAQRRPGVRR